ncbi:MAG: hypothetical protein HYV05_08995 [Deltaproteobacteria bacterium]|nr:hypothetical protein [Deltaproteobacteria bacterium]
MRSIRYWIQHPDFSADEYDEVEIADGLRAFETHAWRNELDLLSQLESAGQECCPPGIGFVASDGSILHVCPDKDGAGLVHFHFTKIRRILGLIPVARSVVESKEGVRRSDVLDIIRFFFEGQQEWLLQKLAGA